jgi:hypothetical protein
VSDLEHPLSGAGGIVTAPVSHIDSSRTDLREEFAKLHTEMNIGFARLQESIRLSVVANLICQLLTTGTILGVAGKALHWF